MIMKYNWSTLGMPSRVTPFVTINREVILRVNLARAMFAEVQLFIRYIERGTGKMTSQTTPTRYAQSEEITYIDENVPFQQFTVDVALVSGAQKGPLIQGSQMHGRFLK